MKFDDSTPRSEQTIQGVVFSIPTPYTAGHVLTENEANAMNQLVCENVRNNFAARMKKAQEAGTAVPGQDQLEAYCEAYEFGERQGGGGRTSDPVAREAMNIAREKVKAAIAKKGIKLSDVPAKKITELAQEALKNHPEFMDAARTIVSQRTSLGLEELDLSDAA